MELTRTDLQLQENEDQLMWTRGDNSGLLTVKNVYTTISNTLWHNNIGGWRKNMWSWNISHKIKLFTWLTIENKIHTWDNLQRKG
jgi:hypothetical protein